MKWLPQYHPTAWDKAYLHSMSTGDDGLVAPYLCIGSMSPKYPSMLKVGWNACS